MRKGSVCWPRRNSNYVETMKCDLISPENTFLIEETQYVQVPGSKGSFGILHKHAPIVSSLEAGVVRVVRSDGTELLFNLPDGGFVEVNNEEIAIIAETLSQTF